MRRRGGRMLPRAAGVLAAVLLIGACEGSNLFEGSVTGESPEITTLAVPGSVSSGESFSVQVTGRAPRGVRFIEVRVSGAATDSIRDVFDGNNLTEFTSVDVIPTLAAGSQVLVEAYVQDSNGRNSPVREATVIVTATGPTGSN
jgi:hypothetical protein